MVKQVFDLVRGNPYPGRGIIIGYTPSGQLLSAYFIMGRSENSRNRVFVKDPEGFAIRPFVEEKVEDASLILYRPQLFVKDCLVLTNGDQTDTIVDELILGGSFESALRKRHFEPDAPNYTPRISGLVKFKEEGKYALSILRAGDDSGQTCERFFYEYEPLPGVGHFIHTYETDGRPLPSFRGEPRRVAIPENMKEFANNLWQALSPDNRVALYVRKTDLKTGKHEDVRFNRHETGGQA